MPDNRKGRNELMNSVALLVVDAQDCFIDTIHNKEEFLVRSAFAIEAARCLKIHTIFTEQAADKLGSTNPRLLSLAQKPKIFHKRSFSALASPGIEQYLRDHEIYHLLVIGLETPICIYQTGLQAADEDIDITFFTDAIGARRKEDEGPVIDELRRQGCHFLPSETVFYSLLQEVTNPYFRVFNGLVKNYGNKSYDADEFKTAAPQSAIEDEVDDTEPRPSRRQQAPSRRQETDSDDRDQNRDANRRRRPRRRRGRRDDRPREEQSSSQQAGQETRPEAQARREEKPARDDDSADKRRKERKPRRRPNTNRPERELRESPPAPVESNSPAKETPSGSDPKPAKKAAKKAARKTATKKVAKKAAKKVAKKAAKKVARKAAKKTSSESPSSE